MSADWFWGLGLASVAGCIISSGFTGPSNLTTALAILAYLFIIMALLLEEPAPKRDRGPW